MNVPEIVKLSLNVKRAENDVNSAYLWLNETRSTFNKAEAAAFEASQRYQAAEDELIAALNAKESA